MSTAQSDLLRIPDLEQSRADYLAAGPWHHLVLHDVVPEDLLLRAAAEAVAVPDAELEWKPTRRQRKRETGNGESFGPATLEVLGLLEGDRWRAFLERVTGVPDLEGDPGRYGAGLHLTETGGFTMIHTDFPRHPDRRHHRVNTLVYLNAGWQDAWGGSLELWPMDMSELGRRVRPELGTVVVWETHAGTPHGLPDPVDAPDGRPRAALAVYHYTQDAPVGRPARRLSTSASAPRTRGGAASPATTTCAPWAAGSCVAAASASRASGRRGAGGRDRPQPARRGRRRTGPAGRRTAPRSGPGARRR